MTLPDKRLHAYRLDLADIRLKGLVEAERFVEGKPMQVAVQIASVTGTPRDDARQTTEALMGERLKVFSLENGWAWVQLDRDGYVGYVRADALSADVTMPSHRVAVPSTFIYPLADLKSQPARLVTMNAMICASGEDGKFTKLATGGYVFTRHLKAIADNETDFVAVAEKLLHTPYYWGGKSTRGIDCSGLVQLSLEACGVAAPRDSDMQEKALGRPLLINDLDRLARGDLVFWDGHVGIMTNAETLLHANGHHMQTVAEPLCEAVDRIAASYGQITSIKRP